MIAKRGYDEAELKLGQELHDKAQTGFQGRHSSLGAAQEAKEARDKAEALARGDFDDYRKTVRVRFDDPATRRAFGADGVVPADIQKFITTARAAYEAALKSSHATWLAKRSYTTERLNELLTNLKTLLGLQAAFATDKGRATGATDERDNSVSVLSAWTREFRTNVTLALKGRADLLQALGM